MNIAIVTPYFNPAWSYGGPPKVMDIFARELQKLSHKVTVITTDSLGDRRSGVSRESISGVDVYRFKNLSNHLAYQYKFFCVPGLLQKSKHILQKADFVLFSDLRPFIHWQIYRHLIINHIPYGIFSFGQIPYDDTKVKGLIKRAFDKLWVEEFVSYATLRFAQTKHEKEIYIKHFHIHQKDIQILFLPVELPSSVQSMPNVSDSEKDIFHMIIIARFHHLKGIDIVIDSIIPLIKNNRHIKLTIIGRDDGALNDLKKIIPEQLSDNISISAPLYGKELDSIYKKASCFILTPRFYEETPLAGLDALAHGIGAIVTKEAQIPCLEEYEAGIVIPNKPDSIRNAVQKFYSKWKKNPNIIRENAIRLIKEQYHKDKVTRRLNQFIKSSPNHHYA